MCAMPCHERTTLGRERNRTQTRSCFCTLTATRLRPPSLNPASPAAIENWPLEAAAARLFGRYGAPSCVARSITFLATPRASLAAGGDVAAVNLPRT
jgi:hypothetical protein